MVDDSGSGDDGYSWYLRDEKREKVPRDDDPVRAGNNYIVADGEGSIYLSIYLDLMGKHLPSQNDADELGSINLASIITLTNETPLTRTATKLSKTRKKRLHNHRRDAFTTAVRDRDRGCVVTKLQNHQLYIDAGVWDTFDAAHIFPPAYAGVWKRLGLDRYITVPGPGPGAGPGQGGGGGESKIDSVQNGILLRSHIHALFDCYAFSICPKVQYSSYIRSYTSSSFRDLGGHIITYRLIVVNSTTTKSSSSSQTWTTSPGPTSIMTAATHSSQALTDPPTSCSTGTSARPCSPT